MANKKNISQKLNTEIHKKKTTQSRISGLIPIGIFIIIWEFSARTGLIPGNFFMPSFSEIIETFYNLLINGVIFENLGYSLLRVLAGFILGTLAGITVGIIMARSYFIDRMFNPILALLYPIPSLGWLPILIILFGIGNIVPVILIFICSFFPLMYNTYTGIKNVPKEYIHAAETLGASNFTILKTILIPLALPNIFTGLRLEAGMAWRTVIAAEMIAIPTGIGALLMKGESLVRMDVIIVCLIVLSLMSLLFEKFFSYLEVKMTGDWI